MSHISIIIVHYNTEGETKNCLQSLQSINKKKLTVNTVVVDNGSKKPLQLPKKYLEHNTEVIRSEANLGFAGGNNLGIEYAFENHQPDYVLLLNSDTHVTPEFLQELHTYLEAHPETGFVSPKINFTKGNEFHQDSYKQNQKGNVLWFAGGVIDWNYLTAFHKGVDEVDRGQFDETTTENFVSACCLLARTSTLQEIGLFTTDLFLYWEDVDLCLRARRAGWNCDYYPQTMIWHDNGGSSEGAGSNLHLYYQTRNKLWMGWHYGTPKVKLLVARELFRSLLSNYKVKRLAGLDFLVGRMGKRTIF